MRKLRYLTRLKRRPSEFFSRPLLVISYLRYLRQLGHDVVTVKQLSQQKSPDPDLLALAESLDRVFITEDRDFGDILLYPPTNYQGIIVVSTRTRERVILHATLQKYLNNKTHDDLRHVLILIEENIVRMRR